MKKLLALLLTFILILTGCTVAPDSTTDTSETTETVYVGNEPVMQSPLVAVSVPASTETETAQDGTALFHYTSQHMKLIMPDSEVADKVVLDFLNRIDKSATAVEELRQQAISQYRSSEKWIPYEYSIIYNPKRIDQGILSLFGTEIDYSGEAHPNYSCLSINYDLITGDTLTLGSILVHENALPSLKALLIAQLNAIKEEKHLREDYKDIVNRRFEGEESYDEDWFFTATGLCFYFPPYEIAPYSSGIIVAEIPYEKLTGIMSDAFFPAEQASMTGSVTVTPLAEADITAYTQIAELTLRSDSDKYLLHTDGAVGNLQIIYTDPVTEESYTPYAMQQLTSGDAVRLEVNADIAKYLTVNYQSNEKTVSIPIQ